MNLEDGLMELLKEMFVSCGAGKVWGGDQESWRRGVWRAVSPGNRLAESSDAGPPGFSPDHANGVVNGEQILMSGGFGAEQKIAHADVGCAGDGELAGNPPGKAKSIAGREVHIPLMGAISQMPAALESGEGADDDDSEKNHQQ